MATIRKGGWIASQRSKLSASRGPHKSNPKDFYYDAESAPERLAQSISYAGEVGEELTVETEVERLRHLAGREGISWRSGGRNFTKEYWNPLVGLWVDRQGLGFALDLLLEGIEDPRRSAFMGHSERAPWIGMRRYLFAATEEEYAAERARVEPIFEDLQARSYARDGDRDMRSGCEVLAFAFSRGSSEWADRCLVDGLDEGKASSVNHEMLVGATLEPELALRAFTGRGRFLFLEHAFDMVESLGGDAIQAFDVVAPFVDSKAKKRLEQARKVAEKVAAL